MIWVFYARTVYNKKKKPIEDKPIFYLNVIFLGHHCTIETWIDKKLLYEPTFFLFQIDTKVIVLKCMKKDGWLVRRFFSNYRFFD